MAQILDNLLNAIGQTPVLRLSRLSKNHDCRTDILAKLECMNPGGSVKDRAARAMLEGALSRGELKEGGAVLCASAGSAGLSIAMTCAVLGLRCVIVLPDSVPPARRKHLERFGAEVLLTPAKDGAAGCQARVEELHALLPEAFIPDQFRSDDNSECHHQTGQEILEQVGQVDFFVAGVGSGGTITGCAERIRMDCPDCRIIAVEPYASPVLSGGFPGGHPLTGIGPGFIPEILNMYILDEIIRVNTPDSIDLMRELARTEGLLCGPSSGAALSAAIEVAQRPEAEGKTVVTVLPDIGERYLEEF